MWATIKKAWAWSKSNFKLILLGVAVVLFFIFLAWLRGKNKRIKELENTLASLQAKLELERLSLRYNTEINNLTRLKEEDTLLRDKLKAIEDKYVEKVDPLMTAEEIAAKFNEMGIG